MIKNLAGKGLRMEKHPNSENKQTNKNLSINITKLPLGC